MLEKFTGIVILAGIVLSVYGAVINREDLKITGVVVLLTIATVAFYRYLKFYALTPTRELTGICLEHKRIASHYILSFKTGSGEVYAGRAGLQLGENIKLGERARLKVKGPVILEINKLTRK